MMTANIGHSFYKDYFRKLKIRKSDGVPTLDGKTVTNKLEGYSLESFKNCFTYFTNDFINQENEIKLLTTYPGLLIGSGYIHEIRSKEKDHNKEYLVKNELKLGFFFDYTTGLPCIPGSSVKGVLRSAFKHSDYIKEIIKELGNGERKSNLKEDFNTFDSEKINKDLTDKIFGSKKPSTSVYKRDIFFDAYPVSSINDDSKFFANDYITPHDNPLQNPKPIQFLKILPQVTFQFNFKLQDFKDEDGNPFLKAEQKKELFKQILLDLGIGAKTNVGYGQFEDPEKNNNNQSDNEISISLNPGKTKDNIQNGDVLKAKIISLKGGLQLDLGVKGIPFKPRISGIKTIGFIIGQTISVKVIMSGKRMNFQYVK